MLRTYARQLSHRDVAHVIEYVLFPHTKNQKVKKHPHARTSCHLHKLQRCAFMLRTRGHVGQHAHERHNPKQPQAQQQQQQQQQC